MLVKSEATEGTPLTADEAAALVGQTNWYHRFELRPGLTTPGVSDMSAKAACDALGIPSDLSGLRGLDIGAWDGPITFELERRGADAAALDIQDPTRVGFDTARRVIGSHAAHYQGSVYQLPTEELRDLDLIVFRGVYYHLKAPIIAFERIAMSLKIGGKLYFEGEGFINYAETLVGKQIDRELARQIADSDLPICLNYPNQYKSSSNWSIPNAACLRSWMQAAGLEVRSLTAWTDGGQRYYGCAEKVKDYIHREHPIY